MLHVLYSGGALLAARLYLDRELACRKIGHLHLMVRWKARRRYVGAISRPWANGGLQAAEASEPRGVHAEEWAARAAGRRGEGSRGQPGAALSQGGAMAANRLAASPLQTR